ncbi:sodium/glutamate symporter [Psychrobacter sanguinis]|uniref:sodium/glutamate symporter n=1 Tax=Psychrobacter sanguinis TaxID=861445 RepID=UPI00020C9C1D|nr:sodium/glutamate symporter [Psychrobacter sanguinis]EGK08126.1 ESS family glutamate:sodium (Na+) symporter [Psychrobacter sp. 1501(2011)]MCC3306811.1 sodium/glutamate symporter [Psychrobacter sanguinis]MCC3309408.1 sodium/glutamate symporter [Psychrobacter sanguinis]MCC3345383.1 sodium/glutamate symporter [Psychrobacter sanguinis]MCD9152114.1 sodium/glutamate symporter [Psychrobacter sanguinis]
MEVTLNGYYTMILATLVLLLGRFLVKKIKFLEDFNIPEPVAGGLLAAVVVYALNFIWGYSFNFQQELQTACMLMFFASIGLSADFGRLKAGGTPLLIFTVVVSAFIVIQDIVGVSMAALLGLDPLLGLVTGSIALTGGHGTAGAWGITLEQQYGVVGATTLGIAVATYGLVAGGVIGGPVARRLINQLGVKPAAANPNPSETERLAGKQSLYSTKHSEEDVHRNKEIFEKPDNIRLITASSTIESLALFAAALAFADAMTVLGKGTWFDLPTFVWALAGGVIIRNVLTIVFDFHMFDRAIDVFGNASLSLFLAMALLSLKLWELTDLAGPVLIILVVQTLVMIAYVYFVTFRVMGKNYDAAVLSAGHCGFGMGATPTAIANMQAVTDRYLASPKAFLIVPMVGAFFVDIINATVLQIFIKLPFM